jgi:quinol monooxygenase YgiN
MRRLLFPLVLLLLASWSAGAQTDVTFYAVSYVETMAASRPAAVAALGAYRTASQKVDGCVRVELFEQTGRPGHFALVETWRDQKAFDARDAALQRGLRDALQPIRVSDYDQRPYKTLSVGRAAPETPQAVVVVTHVDVSPSPAVAPMLVKLAEASRQEKGNLRFDVTQHTMRANHFTIVEVWQNQAALDSHVAAAHTKAYRDELQPLTGSPLDERAFTRVP